MTTSIIRETCTDMFAIIKRNPWLAILGFFATFLGQIGLVGVWNMLGSLLTQHASLDPILFIPELWRPVVLPVSLLSLDGALWLICLAIIAFGSAMLLLSASAISQGSLMHCMYQWRHHDIHPDMNKAWHQGSKHVGRVVMLNALRLGIIYILAIIVAHAFLLSLFDPSVINMTVYAVLFLLAAICAIGLSVTLLFATGYTIMDEQPILKSISSGFALFRSHWLQSIEVGVLIAFVQVAGSLFIALLAGLLLLPTVYVWFLFVAFVPFSFLAILFGIVLMVLGFGVLFASSCLTVAITLLWSDVFLRMHHVGMPSGIKHMFRHWPFLHSHIGKSV